MSESKKPTQKDLWIANLLAYLHNCFIGISHLECTEEECPLVNNWDYIEEKNSKKGLCALYKITDDNFLVVDATVGNSTDLGTYENIEITLPSGTKRKTAPKEENIEKNNVQTSGTLPNKKKPSKEIFLKDDEFVLFFNNQSRSANLQNAEDIYLNDLWNIKEKINWDQYASKKIVLAEFETDPDDDDWEPVINGFEKGFISKIAPDNITNSIKKTEFLNAGNNNEREKLWTDYKEIFSELRRVFGIRHLTSKKEERQNNPEIELNEAQFIALERRKKRIREQSIAEAETKQFCTGIHTLTYGTAPEQREEKVQELEEIKELDEKETEKSEENNQE